MKISYLLFFGVLANFSITIYSMDEQTLAKNREAITKLERALEKNDLLRDKEIFKGPFYGKEIQLSKQEINSDTLNMLAIIMCDQQLWTMAYCFKLRKQKNKITYK